MIRQDKLFKTRGIITINIIFVVIAIFATSSGCGSKNKPEELINDVAPTIVENRSVWVFKQYMEPGSVKPIEQWAPKRMEAAGQLVLKWSKDFIKYEGHGEKREKAIGLPNDWGIMMRDRFEKDEDIIHGIIDPNNGNYHPAFGIIGKTDGQRIYQDDNSGFTVSTCVSVDSLEKLWARGGYYPIAGGQNDNYIINGSLLYSDNYTSKPNSIKRVDPETGNVIWSLELHKENGKEIGIDDCAPTKNYLWVFISSYTDPEKDYRIEALHKIDPQSGEVWSMNDINKAQIYSLIGSGSNELFVLTQEKDIAVINESDDKLTIIQTSSEFKEFANKNMQVNFAIVNDRLFIEYGPDGNLEHYVLDAENKKIEELRNWKSEYMSMSNSTLILSGLKQITAIDPITFKQLWWIDQEDIESNGGFYVMWTDWRGALVKADDKIMCFGPK